MTLIEILVQLLVAAAAFLQGVTGIGFALVAGPVLLMALNDASALQITALLNLLIALVLAPSVAGRADMTLLKRFGAAALIALPFGLALFALPIGILATGFQQEIHRREVVVTWGMVARVPAFQHLSAGEVAEIMRLLNTRRHRRGELIMTPGDPATEMFFISSGEVQVAYDGGPSSQLAEGDFFGERGILGEGRRRGRATALTDVMLLVLESADLERIMARNPGLRAQVTGQELADE